MNDNKREFISHVIDKLNQWGLDPLLICLLILWCVIILYRNEIRDLNNLHSHLRVRLQVTIIGTFSISLIWLIKLIFY